MTRAEALNLYYRTLDWKECYYEAQAKMSVKKEPTPFSDDVSQKQKTIHKECTT